MTKFPIARPYITAAEYRNVRRVLKSGILSIGPMVEAFEQRFAKLVGTTYACAVNSGTAGLHLAMIAAGIQTGDEVITSPFSFVASSNAILYVGAKPVFCDIDPQTFNLDPAKIEQAITKKTKAILAVHIFGQAANMHPIMKIARKHRLIVIEDACESILATYRGKQVGTFGQSAVFAFYPNKQMTTAEGGMIVTNSKRVYDLCASLRNQGRSKSMEWLDHERLGYNYRLDELSAAVGLAQLEKLRWMIRQRQKIAAWYTAAFAPFRHLVETPAIAPGNTHTWFVYVIRLSQHRWPRDLILKKLKSHGIVSKVYLPSIHLFGMYKKMFGFRPGDFPISERVSSTSLALPLYIGLTERNVQQIAAAVIRELQPYARHLRK